MSFLQPELSFAPIAATTFSSSRVNTTTYSSITFTGQSNDNTTVTFNWYNDSISAAIGSDSYSIPNTSIAITYTFNIRTQYVSMTVTPTATITGTLQTLFNKALSIGNGPIGPTGPTGPAFGTQLYTACYNTHTTTVPLYGPITGAVGLSTSLYPYQQVMGVAGTFSDFTVCSTSFPFGGTSRVHRLLVNGVGTSLMLTLTSSDRYLTDSVNTVVVGPYDYVVIYTQDSPTYCGGYISISIRFTPS